MKNIFIIMIIISLLLAAGCSGNTDSDNNESEVLESQIKTLNLEIQELGNTIAVLEDDAKNNLVLLEDCLAKIPEDIEVNIINAGDDPRIGREWTELESYSFDLDSDGALEIVYLYTSSLSDNEGNVMWDDGQTFLLLVDDGDSVFTLFMDYVQLGRVYFSINGQTNARDKGIFIITATFAGISIEEFNYVADEAAYSGKPVFSTGAMNIFYTSIPWD